MIFVTGQNWSFVMTNHINVFVEKRTAYGWSLATTPEPSPFWSRAVPDAEVMTCYRKAVDYHTQMFPLSSLVTEAIPSTTKASREKLQEHLTLEEAAVLFGEEPWFVWNPGTSEHLTRPNHPLFALLTAVENVYGFQPIDVPRDLPDDVSAETLEYYQAAGQALNASHVSLEELEAVKWNWINTARCWVSEAEFNDLQRVRQTMPNAIPSKFFHKPMGQNGIGIQASDLLDLQTGRVARKPNCHYYLPVTFKASVETLIGVKRKARILSELARYGAPDEVRMVFWFEQKA